MPGVSGFRRCRPSEEGRLADRVNIYGNLLFCALPKAELVARRAQSEEKCVKRQAPEHAVFA
eukprot:6881876-Alexandrium_andersonii.AAC.1